MSNLKFSHFFFVLMALATLCAFILPRPLGDSAKAPIDGLFRPVSSPVRSLALGVSRRWGGKPWVPVEAQSGPRTTEQIEQENRSLRNLVANLSAQVDYLRQREAEWARLGDLRQLCEPYLVTGGDTEHRQSLSLGGVGNSSLSNLAAGMAVLHGQGLVGKIEFASGTGARVELVTDVNFRATTDFGHFVQNEPEQGYNFVKLAMPNGMSAVSVAGDGKGRLRIEQLSLEQVKKMELEVGDVVRLADTESWPPAIQGAVLGQVESIAPQNKSPLSAEIIVKPPTDLMKLREVMVMTKK